MRPAKFIQNVFLVILFSYFVASAQTTEFTYQGSLREGADPANGIYDFQFLLFDALVAGGQVGTTATANGVAVSDGVFTFKLDFGNQFATGSSRWLEVRVRPSGSGGFTTLAPRNPVASIPYAVRSLNAATADGMSTTCIGCINSANIATVNGSAVTGAIPVASIPAGSGSYIQNSTSPQTANFNITGQGTLGSKLSAQTVNTSTRFEINNARVLGVGAGGTLFVGQGAGSVTTGELNTFVGAEAGLSNTIGAANAFFGVAAGRNQIKGFSNSFFGRNAGMNHDGGEGNSFFGAQAGANSSSGSRNSFFGGAAGYGNTGGDNSFFGTGAGGAAGNWSGNSFFGALSGLNNRIGNNSFFGAYSGVSNTIGFDNTFLGFEAGRDNTFRCCNTFVGSHAGRLTNDGTGNTFLGNHAGHVNTNGDNNVLVGSYAGSGLQLGSGNSFLGWGAGEGVIGGSNNTYIGHDADQTGNGHRSKNTTLGAFAKTDEGDNSTAIGAHAYVTASNAIVLGSIFAVNGANVDTNVGIGTTAPSSRLHVVQNSGAVRLGNPCNPGFGVISFNPSILNCSDYSILGDGNDTIVNRKLGGTIQFRENNFAQVIVNAGGTLSLLALGSAGSTQLCRNASNAVSTCSSSLRYKTNVTNFTGGMSFIDRLRPISFEWKDAGMKDVGFGAEDVAVVDARFATLNDKGEIEGVKYDRLSVVFVNAFKEQQAQISTQKAVNEAQQKRIEAQEKRIEGQQKLIDQQQKQIDDLKEVVCSLKPDDAICKKGEN